VIERLLHDPTGAPVAVRATELERGAVLFGARAHSHAAAEHGIARMRFATGVDDDLSEFVRRFKNDPLIGRSVSRRPWLRASRRPEPFEAFVWAVCEQLIEYEQAVVIQRRLVARLGRPRTGEQASLSAPQAWASGLRDSPAPGALAGAAPASLEACGLSPTRALALHRAAREVAAGRVDLHDSAHERGWQRLRAIRGIGAWTVEILALCGQGRYDQLPAGDLGLLKLAGRLLSGGNPRARASEQQVRELFAPYGEWAGLAAVHAAGL